MGRTHAEAWEQVKQELDRQKLGARALYSAAPLEHWTYSTVATQLSRDSGPGVPLLNAIGEFLFPGQWVPAELRKPGPRGPRGPRRAREHSDVLNTMVALLDRHGVGDASQPLGYRLVLLNDLLRAAVPA